MFVSALAPSPTPSPRAGSPVLELFSRGLTWSELWSLLWPALAGAGLLFCGAALVVGYLRQWFNGNWSPHWSRLTLGLIVAAASLPLFLLSRHRVESKAAALGVPVSILLLAIANQLGVAEDGGGRRRRRR